MDKTTKSPGKLQQISPGDIDRNPDNPRLIFRQEEMERLLVSINTHGIQVPVAVYREDDGYRLIDGERRWRCARKLNLRTVPALIQEKTNRTRQSAVDVQHPRAPGTVGILHDCF